MPNSASTNYLSVPPLFGCVGRHRQMCGWPFDHDEMAGWCTASASEVSLGPRFSRHMRALPLSNDGSWHCLLSQTKGVALAEHQAPHFPLNGAQLTRSTTTSKRYSLGSSRFVVSDRHVAREWHVLGPPDARGKLITANMSMRSHSNCTQRRPLALLATMSPRSQCQRLP